MSTYDVNVTREGKWWMIAIPALNGLTQARRLSEAEEMARDWIALTLDVPLDDIAVNVSVAPVAGVDVEGALGSVARMRLEADTLESKALALMADVARRLAAADVPVRDIGALLGVSFQRAHQLVTKN